MRLGTRNLSSDDDSLADTCVLPYPSADSGAHRRGAARRRPRTFRSVVRSACSPDATSPRPRLPRCSPRHGSARRNRRPTTTRRGYRRTPCRRSSPALTDRRCERRGAWRSRRAELLDLFAAHMYGRTPPGLPTATVSESMLRWPCWTGGMATAVAARWEGRASVDVLVYRPRHDRKVPVFIGLNYFGNHAVDPDPAIRLSTRWMRASEANGIVDHRATEASRGTMARRWPIDLVIAQDCAVMTAYYGDLAPDDPAVVRQGIAPLADGRQERIPEAERWGAIGMWAWGLSQMRQRAERMPGLDAGRAIVIGHSRLGKAALWAGVQDEGFAMVVSNDSGCAGAALSRRIYGETIGRITHGVPALVLPDVVDVRRARVGDAGRPAPVAGAGRAAGAARRQCDRRPLGGSARRVPGDAGRRRGLAAARRRGLGVTEMPPVDTAGGRACALPHAHRWSRHHAVRLGAVPGDGTANSELQNVRSHCTERWQCSEILKSVIEST